MSQQQHPSNCPCKQVYFLKTLEGERDNHKKYKLFYPNPCASPYTYTRKDYPVLKVDYPGYCPVETDISVDGVPMIYPPQMDPTHRYYPYKY